MTLTNGFHDTVFPEHYDKLPRYGIFQKTNSVCSLTAVLTSKMEMAFI